MYRKNGLNARAKMTNLIHSQNDAFQVQSLAITKLNNDKANRHRISA